MQAGFVPARWQWRAFIAVGGGLIAVIHETYATVYTALDLQVWWLAAHL